MLEIISSQFDFRKVETVSCFPLCCHGYHYLASARLYLGPDQLPNASGSFVQQKILWAFRVSRRSWNREKSKEISLILQNQNDPLHLWFSSVTPTCLCLCFILGEILTNQIFLHVVSGESASIWDMTGPQPRPRQWNAVVRVTLVSRSELDFWNWTFLEY